MIATSSIVGSTSRCVQTAVRRVCDSATFFPAFSSLSSRTKVCMATSERHNTRGFVSKPLSDQQKYLFDTLGYCVLRGALSPEEVEAANAAIDKHSAEICERDDPSIKLANGSTTLQGNGRGRYDLGGMLGWPSPDNKVFRDLLCHENILPALYDLVGEGYRLDHAPLVLLQRKGSEGFNLHGGACTPEGQRNYSLAYDFYHGKMRCNLVNVSVALTPTEVGDGGFCIIPGSHKSNYPCPEEIIRYEDCQEITQQVPVAPGDVILFAEAAQHGTLPW
eukprot:CAMPEP_0177602058 /NCGR_PEP_ID=MMETSP0419_2-20121207/14650_1 /TAXON_ID=582737 /ORGANISM="Tetraselmis sp., Strain GSL018" /LENGTH=276 /DNA_ID=CAMNT_0019095485 /DNA_START=844 /DNA_END=1671 /DNA_ORIENTATION=-